ncbi:MAG: hypothetical protein KAH22_09580 [Thiotrichaceae bacterium]|nr:hypothetical protein [Thiotrichaceae bacterium]
MNKSVTYSNTPSLLESAGKAIKEFATISELMRIVGAIGVLASMSVFLMQGWGDSSDIELFLLMLLQTTLLAAAGFVMFKGLKENKSARLFFGLGLVSMAVNFTTLGALFYAVFHLDTPVADYATYAKWVPSDVGTLVLASIGSIVLLLPLAYFSFSVLSRPAAKQLTLWYFGLNILLLLPLRDPSLILAITLAVLLAMGYFLSKKGSAQAILSNGKTLEGKFARIILFAPLMVFVLRSLFWYEVDNLAILMMFATTYIMIRQVSLSTKNTKNTLLNGLSLALGLIGALWVSIELVSVPSVLITPIFTMIFIASCVDVYLRADHWTMQRVVYNLGSIVMAVALTLNHLFFESALTFVIALFAGLAIFSVAYYLRSTFNIILSTVMMLILPILYGSEILSMVFNSGWLGLAISGVSIIVLASVVDRYGAVIKLKLIQKKQEFVSITI